MDINQQIDELNILLGIDMNEYITNVRRGLVHNGIPDGKLASLMSSKYSKYYQVISTRYTNGFSYRIHANAHRTGTTIIQSDKYQRMNIRVEHFDKDHITRLSIGLYEGYNDMIVDREDTLISLEFKNYYIYQFDYMDKIVLTDIHIGSEVEALLNVDKFKKEFIKIIQDSNRNIKYDIKQWETTYENCIAKEQERLTSPSNVIRLYFKKKPNRISYFNYIKIHQSENSIYHGKILAFEYRSIMDVLKETELPDLIEIERDGQTMSITGKKFAATYPEHVLTVL